MASDTSQAAWAWEPADDSARSREVQPLNGVDSVVKYVVANEEEDSDSDRSEHEERASAQHLHGKANALRSNDPIKPGSAALVENAPTKPATIQTLPSVSLLREGSAKTTTSAARTAAKPHSVADRINYRLDIYITSRRGQIATLCVVAGCIITSGGCSLKVAEPILVWADSIWDAWTYLSAPLAHTELVEPVGSILCVCSMCGIYDRYGSGFV